MVKMEEIKCVDNRGSLKKNNVNLKILQKYRSKGGGGPLGACLPKKFWEIDTTKIKSKAW